ncbi:galactose-specific lectin nattectin [Lampris incognitus]|uniref:galactose-specific lectin nattectin n=1 Tax=Lampris incognitus TaxID=2546036 RepID=UPI0024B569A5|nr:galactose-specific lectin nattectin [Lampris incognitus]
MTVLCVSLTLCAVLSLSGAASLNSTVISFPWSLCERHRHIPPDIIGAYIPQCDLDGNFSPRQCWASSGYCWCVNTQTGEEIPGTRTPPGTLPLDCELHATTDETAVMNNFCPTGWSRFGMRCFIFITVPKMWIEAQVYCLFEGATLASIHNNEQNRFIQALTRGDGYEFPNTWIGGTDGIQACLWLWIDGTRFDYNNWNWGEDDHQNANCLEINYGASLRWRAMSCDTILPFVCAKRI